MSRQHHYVIIVLTVTRAANSASQSVSPAARPGLYTGTLLVNSPKYTPSACLLPTPLRLHESNNAVMLYVFSFCVMLAGTADRLRPGAGPHRESDDGYVSDGCL